MQKRLVAYILKFVVVFDRNKQRSFCKRKNMEMVKDLFLSRRTRLEFVNLPDDARLKLAAEELERLVKRRFASKSAPDQRVEVFFEIKENAKGFS